MFFLFLLLYIIRENVQNVLSEVGVTVRIQALEKALKGPLRIPFS